MHDFDIAALFAALDAQREERALTWAKVAREISEQSSVLNARRPNDHPLSPSTITGMTKRNDTSCQHALMFLRWLGRAPESFIPRPAVEPKALPAAGPDRRLRWDLEALAAALDEHRHTHELTWAELARNIDASSNQLSGLRNVRYAIGMRLAMRITGALQRPAADFVYAAKW